MVLAPTDSEPHSIINLQAGCGTCKDLGAGCMCANFRFTEGARAQRGVAQSGESNEPDSREVSEGNASLRSYVILARSLVCSLHCACGAVPCPRVCTACV